MQGATQLFKQKVWEAIISGCVPSLETVIWEIITAEVHSGRCCFRKALLVALDGSEFATESHRNELLQRFAAQSGAGDTDAQCFIGILLCFQGGHDGNEFVMPAHGVKFLHAAAERHNNLATLLLALCFECGKGVEVSTDAAKQCYNMASTRGYQMAQIFLKELVRDTTFASQQAAQQQQQQRLQQMQSNLQAANLSALGGLGALGGPQTGLQGGLHPALRSTQGSYNQSLQFNPPPQLNQAGNAALGGLNAAQLGNFSGLTSENRPFQPPQDLIDQQVAGAKRRLQTAVQEQDVQALATAIEWAQEVQNATQQQIQELASARSILHFCQEHQRFPELSAAAAERGREGGLPPSRAASPAPSHRSNAASLAGVNVPASPASQTGPRSPKAELSAEGGKAGSKDAPKPTAAEQGAAFFQQGLSDAEVPMEPLEVDVDKTPSEQPMPADVNLEDLESAQGTPTAKIAPSSSPNDSEQNVSPAVAIPKRGLSSHGSIGDRRTLGGGGGSVVESEPPLTREALDMFNLFAQGAGSRSAPNSHRDAFDRLSVASLSSLQPPAKKEGSPPTEGDRGEEKTDQQATKPLDRSASTRPPSPNASLQGDAVRRSQSALGLPEDGKTPLGFEELSLAPLNQRDGIDVDRLVSPEDLATLASKGVSITALRTAFSSTTDPEKLEAYARGIRQLLDSAKQAQQPQQEVAAVQSGPALTSPFGALAGQQSATADPTPNPSEPPAPSQPQDNWGKLMQALHGNVTGLDGEPLGDYLHNLHMLCGEDPTNDMVMPPSQSIPGIEAVLGALQAQGTSPQQQQEFLRLAATAATAKNQQQATNQLRSSAAANLQALNQQQQVLSQLQNQQRLGQQGLNPGLPVNFQALGNDLGSRFPGGIGQNALNGNPSQPGAGQFAYSQALNNLGARRYNQPLNAAGGFGQAGPPDMSQLVDLNQGLASRLQNSAATARAGLGAPGLIPPMPPQVRGLPPQNNLGSNYEQVWGMYGNKAGGLQGQNPNLLGAAASIKANANRFAPGLPTKPVQPDLYRSMLNQGSMANNLSLGLNNLTPGMAGGANPWNLTPANRLGTPALGNQMLNSQMLGSQGLGNQMLGSQGLGNQMLGSQGLGNQMLGSQGLGNQMLGSQGLGNQMLGSQGLGNQMLGNQVLASQGLGGNLLGAGLSGSGLQGLQGYQNSQGAQPGLQTLPQNAASLQAGQGLPSNSNLQNLRLSLNQTPQPIGPPAGSQPLKLEPGGSTYSLFKAPSTSLPAAPTTTGQSLNGSPSQPMLQTSSPFPVGGLESSLGSQPEGSGASSFAGLGNSEAARKAWGSSTGLTASLGLASQPSNASDPPISLAGWNSTDSLQQLQNKSVRPAYYVGMGGDDSLAQAFRQKPPRPVGAMSFTSQPQQLGGASPVGSLAGQPQNLLNSVAGLGSETNNTAPSLASGLGSGGNLAGLTASASLAQHLGTGFSAPGSGFGSSGSAALGGGAARLPSSLLNPPRSGRFPGSGF